MVGRLVEDKAVAVREQRPRQAGLLPLSAAELSQRLLELAAPKAQPQQQPLYVVVPAMPAQRTEALLHLAQPVQQRGIAGLPRQLVVELIQLRLQHDQRGLPGLDEGVQAVRVAAAGALRDISRAQVARPLHAPFLRRQLRK